MRWTDKINFLSGVLSALEITDAGAGRLDTDDGFERLKKLIIQIRAGHGSVFAVGNGASASMCSHFAADLAKNGRLHTEVFSDLSLITAISNDMGYDQVFAEPLRRRGKKGDALVCVSSSGNSPNVIKAIEVASKIGMTVVTLTAMSPDNKARKLGDINLYLPAKTYGDAESSHAVILHYWIDLSLDKTGAKNNA